MKKITRRILLCFIVILSVINISKAESWDFVQNEENKILSPEKPYAEFDMRWFDWYGKNSYMKSCVLTFNGYSDVVDLNDLCTSDSDMAASIRNNDDTYKTYTTDNFFVELWNPYTQGDDKYSYRVMVRILPRFPIGNKTQFKGKVTVEWVDNHKSVGQQSKTFSAVAVSDTDLYQPIGTLQRDFYKLKYQNKDLKDINNRYAGYDRYLEVYQNNSVSEYSIAKNVTQFETDVKLSGNVADCVVEYRTVIGNKKFQLGKTEHEVEFISSKTETFNGYTYPKNVVTEVNKWDKQIKIKWDREYKGRITDGYWAVYRKNVDELNPQNVEVKNYLDFNTGYYVDTEVEYESDYIYTVAFIPKAWEGSGYAEDLSAVSKTTAIKKEFCINLSVKSEDDYIMLSWAHEKLSGSSDKSYSYTIYKSVNGTTSWTGIKEENNLSRNTTKYSYKDTDVASPCDVCYYRVDVVALNEETFESNIANGQLKGSTELTSFTASRGEYNGIVKISWEVTQVGTEATEFTLYRQSLGADVGDEWSKIYYTKGAENVYHYDDNSAQTGKYYRYKLSIETSCDSEGIEKEGVMEYYADGFCLATGVISGRINYGTGTAVGDVKVSAQKAVDDDNSNEQFYSLGISSVGGVVTGMNKEKAQNIFGNDNGFSVQAWVSLDTVFVNNEKIDEPIIARMPNVFKFSAKKQDQGGFKLNVGSYDGNGMVDALTDISISANKFYHLTLSYDKKANDFTVYAISADTIVSKTIGAASQLDINKSLIDTSKLVNIEKEYFADYVGKSVIAFAACMEDSARHHFNGYIDEIRVWNKPLSIEEIKKNYDHLLAGTEKGLRIYYPLDEGISGQEIAYDYSKTDGAPNGNWGKIVEGTMVSSHCSSMIGLHAYTDTAGNYTIRGVPFRGDGTNYNIIPTYGIHEFSPSAESRYISSSSLNFSGVNFEDVSSFPVSGVVYYKNTTYPVVGASLYVDGVMAVKDNKPVVTNSNGEYTISVPIGDHYIEVKKDRHTFVNGGRYPEDPNDVGTRFTFDREIKDLTFYDETTVMFAGRVTGGEVEHSKALGVGVSEANIGQAKITFSTPYKMNVVQTTEGGAVRYVTNPDTLHYKTDDAPYVNSKAYAGNTDETANVITVFTDPETGEFAVELPPVEYSVDSAVILTNKEITFAELPTFIKAASESVSYTDSVSVDVTPPGDTINQYENRTFKYNASLFLTYRSEPVFIVTEHENGAFGIDTAYCVEANGDSTPVVTYTIGDDGVVEYAYGYPVYETYGTYYYDITAYEEYVNYDGMEPEFSKVPLAGTIIDIQNEFAAGNTLSTQGETDGQIVEMAEKEIELDSAGYAIYEFMGGAPNILEPYTLNLNMSYEVNNKHYDWEQNGKFKAVILGDLPTGNNFVTAGPDQVLMVLRDPPGSQSYSYWEEGTTHTFSRRLGAQIVGDLDVKLRWHNGTGTSLATGAPGLYKISSFGAFSEKFFGFDLSTHITPHKITTDVVTTTEKISTSDDVNFVGAEGDVFIGTSTNIIFGDAREVGFHRDKNTNEIVLNMEDCVIFGEEFTTDFKYTQHYIKSTLIPNTIKLRDELLLPKGTSDLVPNDSIPIYYISNLETTDPNYGTSNIDPSVWGDYAYTVSREENGYIRVIGKSYDILHVKNASGQDTIQYYNESVRNWENILKENEKAKYNAIDGSGGEKEKNISVDGGVSYEYKYNTNDIEGWDVNSDVALSLFGQHGLGLGSDSKQMEFLLNGTVSLGFDGSWEDTDEESDTKGYVIKDDNASDAFSIDVYKDAYGAIFRTRGGQSSCPYEGATVSEYYNKGSVLSESTMRVEYPSIRTDNAILSNVPSGSSAIFDIELANLSETDSDVWYSLSMVDESNPNGAEVAVDGSALTAEGRSVLVPASSSLKKQLIIKQTDASVLDYENIKIVLSSQCQNDPTGVYGAVADTLSLTAHFVPSCSPIELHIDNRVLNVNNKNLSVTVKGYDLNYKSLKGINIEIKGEHDYGWTILKSYVTDPEYVTPDVELLNASEINYTDALTNLSDQNYLVRAVTLCEYGTETINNETEEILITKDLSIPALIATPNPADGILNAGDEVSIVFNEDVKQGEITEVDNIYVKGVLNGSEIAHSVAYASGVETSARTEAAIDLNGRSFTVEMWLKYLSGGILFKHGTSDNSFVAKIDDNGYLDIIINENSAKSLVAMPKDKWVYMSVSVGQENGFANITSVYAYDSEELNLFVDETMPLYTGKGTLNLGEGIEAVIHEVTLWDYARTSIESLNDIYASKSPYTKGLVGYWRLDEGHGTIGTDLARNRHLVISGTNSWYLENENMAIEIEDKEFIAMNVAHCPTTADDNYLIEFWFKGGKQDDAATLLSMNGDDLNISLDDNGSVEVKIDSLVYKSSDNDYLDGNWHHVAINVLKATHGSAIVYVDGENVIQIDADNFPSIQTNELLLGASHGMNDGTLKYHNFFKGAFDEIRYWKGTYTADYIRGNMYSRVGEDEPGLMAYYPMEEMSVDMYNQVVYSSSLNDQSGNDAAENVVLVVNKVENGTVAESVARWTEMTPPLKVAPIYDNVDVSFVASERKILINIDEDPRNVEGCTLIFNVSGVKDVNDNMMNPVTWSAYVRQNQLNWAKSAVDIRKQNGVEESFSVRILNTSGNVEYWSIQNMPSWLEADIQSGELAPLSVETVNFTISDATAIGKYEVTLYLTGNNNIPEPLTLSLVCEGDAPDWDVNPSDFSLSMNMVAQLKINGYVSDDPDDIVAAFIDGRCVGKASPIYNKRYDAYYLMMNIYGNSKSDNGTESDENKEVAFKAYDVSSGELYPTVEASESIVFKSDGIVGELGAPVILSSVDEIQQPIQLDKGWSWISINVNPEDNSLDAVMAPVTENVSFVKSKTESAEFDANGVWHGRLNSITHSTMYKVKSDAATVLDVVGKSVDINGSPITIYNGWNWIGYNPAVIMSLADALADVNPVDGDVIKNRDEFAVFDGYEWVGTLTSMRPGSGYIYNSNDEEKTFVYPSVVGTRRSYADDGQNDDAYSFDYNYSGNMNVIACVKDGDAIVENATIEVFADNVLRGISNRSVVDNKHFLTIHGDSAKDVLSFKVTIDGDVYEISNVMNFNDDAVVGTLDNPYILQINPDIVVTVYPTLVKDIVNISCKDNIKTVTIHNVSGLKVYYDENLGDSTQINVEGLVAGVYIVTVVTESGDVKVVHIVKG